MAHEVCIQQLLDSCSRLRVPDQALLDKHLEVLGPLFTHFCHSLLLEALVAFIEIYFACAELKRQDTQSPYVDRLTVILLWPYFGGAIRWHAHDFAQLRTFLS